MAETRTPKQIAADKLDDGGPAYPQHDLSGYGFGPSERGEHGDEPEDFGTRRYTVEGMSLRDWFAGQALAGLYASRDLQLAVLHDSRADEFEIVMARQAYSQADAMLRSRVRAHMHPKDREETDDG